MEGGVDCLCASQLAELFCASLAALDLGVVGCCLILLLLKRECGIHETRVSQEREKCETVPPSQNQKHMTRMNKTKKNKTKCIVPGVPRCGSVTGTKQNGRGTSCQPF